MRIAHILMSLGSGGIQGVVFSLACEQAKMGHQVLVIPTDECNNEHSDKQEQTMRSYGIEVVRLNRKRGNKLSSLQTLIKCRKIIANFAPDIVNSHATMWHFYGAISCLRKRYKQVATVHSSFEKWGWLVKRMCHDVPIIFCSQSAKEGGNQYSKLSTVVDNGVSPELLNRNKRANLKLELGLPQKAKLIVSVGNLRPVKNYKNLIEIAKIFDGTDYHFIICGGSFGDTYDNPKQYEGYNNLHWIGPRSDIPAIEKDADLFLSSSLYEGLPVAVIEAYFMGIPCVLSPIKEHIAIAEIPKVWIPKDSSLESYIETIKLALENEESHREIYEKRKPYIEKYSIKHTAEKYVDFYKRCYE